MTAQTQINCNSVARCISEKASTDMIAQCQSHSASRSNVLKDVSATIQKFFKAIARSYKRYMARVALVRLTDAQWRDIGLERTQDGIVPISRIKTTKAPKD